MITIKYYREGHKRKTEKSASSNLPVGFVWRSKSESIFKLLLALRFAIADVHGREIREVDHIDAWRTEERIVDSPFCLTRLIGNQVYRFFASILHELIQKRSLQVNYTHLAFCNLGVHHILSFRNDPLIGKKLHCAKPWTILLYSSLTSSVALLPSHLLTIAFSNSFSILISVLIISWSLGA